MNYRIKIWESETMAGYIKFNPEQRGIPRTFWGKLKLLTRTFLMI
jgi:hypothetical protein